MTDDNHIDLSRRKVLGSLGAIGVASAGAGFGTSAYFNDQESFDDNIITAGTLDLKVNYYSYWNQGDENKGAPGSDYVSGTADGEAVSSKLSDVKPGDSGIVAFCPRIETNPAYLWLCGELTASYENGYTEPEPVDENGEGELEENIEVTVSYCELNEIGDTFDPEDIESQTEIWTGTLAEFLATIRYGVPLDGHEEVSDSGFLEPGSQECFYGTGNKEEKVNPCLCLDWEVPTSVGNEIQGDSTAFDLQFYAEQCRHNDGTQNPCSPGGRIGTGDFSEISYEKAFSMQALSRGGSGRGEIQIHGDSGGVENTTLWGSNSGDTFPADTDVDFTAEVNPDAETASLTANGETVTDDDITDGDANGASTGDPEWPNGVPNQVDVALNASSGDSNVTTVVKDVSLNGTPVDPDEISAEDGLTYLAIEDIPASNTVTVEGTLRFEGSTSDFDGQDFVGIDWR